MKSEPALKILHVVPSLDVGGMENGIINLCNNHDRSVIHPIVCCLRSPGKMASRLDPSVEIVNMEMSEGLGLSNVFKLEKLMRSMCIDVVHTHGFGGGSLVGICAAKLARVSRVVNGEHGKFYLKSHQVLCQKVLSAMCDATLSVSSALKKKVVQNLGINSRDIFVIPNGVDTDKFTGEYIFDETLSEVSPDLNNVVTSGASIVSCIGSLKNEKNQIVILKALKSIFASDPKKNIALLIVGDGPDRGFLEDFVKKQGLSSKVFFLGSREDVHIILSFTDILVSSSYALHEGMSNVVLEGMASKVPVITTASVGMDELVRNGDNGYLITDDDVCGLTDKILYLHANKDDRLKMGENARAAVLDQYSVFKMVGSYEQFYRNITSRG